MNWNTAIFQTSHSSVLSVPQGDISAERKLKELIIAVDKNQCTGAHLRSNSRNHDRLLKAGHMLYQLPLPYGDYIQITPQIEEIIRRRGTKLGKADLMGAIKISVDRKASLSEICGNICGGKTAHERFQNELIKAQQCGCKMYILVEDDSAGEVRDVFKWVNPRAKMYHINKARGRKVPSKPPTNGQTIAKAMMTMEYKYGCKFVFCKPSEAAEKIVELLEGEKSE